MVRTNPFRKKSRRRYSDDFRATALAGLAAKGGNVDRTAKALGIPAKTLEHWSKGVNPVPANLGEQKKEELAEAMESFIRRLIGVDLEKFEQMNFRDFGITLGIATDKYLALRGQPNTISKVVDARENVIDPSKMTPAQRKALVAFLDEMDTDQMVKYDPQPGDPDYVPVFG